MKKNTPAPTGYPSGALPNGEARQQLIDAIQKKLPKGQPVPPEEEPGFMSNYDIDEEDLGE